MKPWTGLALMHEPEFMAAALPLFENGEVDVLEWSFDTMSRRSAEPAWLPLLLSEYANQGRLLAHGVRYSLLSGDFSRRQQTWLRQTETELSCYRYRHLSEHFGFMSSRHFHKGAPLPVPLNAASLSIGRDRLLRLQEVAGGIPIGLENLAFAFSADQVLEQGSFLEQLLAPVAGFLVLDLHNIWCQAHNFGVDAHQLIAGYPLHLVREIHVSGGSWSTVSSSEKPVRRDTHDESLPEEVLRLLADTLPLCPYVEAVIFERLGNSLKPENEGLQFVRDFRAIKHTVQCATDSGRYAPNRDARKLPEKLTSGKPVSDGVLHEAQRALISILSQQASSREIAALLRTHPLLKDAWQTGTWTEEMIETAIHLLQKWN